MTLQKITDKLSENKSLAIIFTVVALVIPLQMYLLGLFNNFIIFKVSYAHLIHNINLYLYYPKEYDDVFLYSPTFALLMAPFSLIPYWLCLYLWCGTACLAMYLAIIWLPKSDPAKRLTIVAILLIEFITSVQNTQTSPLIAACIVLIFICFEKKKLFFAALLIIFITFIKIYGIAAAILFVFYPEKGKFIFYFIFWGIIFFFLPLLVIPMKELVQQYLNWKREIMLVHHSEETGINPNLLKPPLSVMEWMKVWFHFKPPAIYVQLAGTAILSAPLIKFNMYKDTRFRYFILSSVLIFCMIFNHIAESPSYIIAVSGVAIWFAWEDRNALTWILIAFAFVFTILSATDMFPDNIRNNYVIPYVLKAVPCIFIWVWIQVRLWGLKLRVH